MDAIPQPPGTEAESGTACDLLAHATVRVVPEALTALRQRPGPGLGERLPAGLLKHADEQTVVGLAAVLQAIDRQGLTAPFTGWGVLGATRFLGRVTLAAAMRRFAAEGAWGLSPHLIPHRSPHALSGTISQALKIHGPNFGVGGGPHGAGEAVLTAAGLLGTRPLPGVWVVLTGWDPEPAPNRDGGTATPAACCAAALALAPAQASWSGLRLRVGPGSGGALRRSAAPLTLERLAAVLEGGTASARPTTWALPHGGWLRLEQVAGLPEPHLFRQRHGEHGLQPARGAGSGSKA